MTPAGTIEPRSARPSLFGRLEDRRQSRRTWLVRFLFIVGLTSWTMLASWWAVYFFRTTVQVRDITLRAYAAEVQLHALNLEHLHVTPEQATAELSGTIFTLRPQPVHETVYPWASAGGTLQGYAVVIRPEEEHRLQSNLHRKFIMLAGEGSLLVGLLFASLVALYRMLVEEVRLRRHQESFVHSVTHELKSPLTGLRALLQSFETLELSRDERRTYLKMGLGEIDRLDHMVANILLSSRLEAEVFKPQLTQIDLQVVLDRLRDRKQLLFQEKGGSVEVRAVPITAKADPEALETILENLVDNAFKYGAEEPRVILTARQNGPHAVIEVTDNGAGLSEADQVRVFQKFYRAPSGEIRQAKGSGLGLFIARGLARACGGELSVRSEGPGKGCTFTLELTT